MSGRHPIGVQPWGNSFFVSEPSTRDSGLGDFALFTDATLLRVIDALDPHSVARLAAVSKILRCFAYYEDFWKKSVLERYEGRFEFCTSWRCTYASAQSTGAATEGCRIAPVKGFYSDLLYQPWFCAHVAIPEDWLTTDNITRCDRLSLKSFRSRFEEPNVPVVLTSEMQNWNARRLWNRSMFQHTFRNETALVGNYEMKFENYIKYCDEQEDEMPLYLFDKAIFHKCPELLSHFTVPEIFSEDFFSLLQNRPDHRWLIMGPERSGSSFHKDPNSTSAWNAVIKGAKKWILYPPSILPPGVHQSPDQSEVATSVSLIEWFLNFYPETQQREMKPVECVLREGEILFVPRGWWHMALNLEETIAITQNFVSRVNLPHVLAFLKTKESSLVSGLPLNQRAQLYDDFVAVMKREHPELMQAAMNGSKGQKRRRLPELFSRQKDTLPSDLTQEASFKFGFF